MSQICVPGQAESGVKRGSEGWSDRCFWPGVSLRRCGRYPRPEHFSASAGRVASFTRGFGSDLIRRSAGPYQVETTVVPPCAESDRDVSRVCKSGVGIVYAPALPGRSLAGRVVLIPWVVPTQIDVNCCTAHIPYLSPCLNGRGIGEGPPLDISIVSILATATVQRKPWVDGFCRHTIRMLAYPALCRAGKGCLRTQKKGGREEANCGQEN